MKKILMLVSGVMLSSSVFATALTAGGSSGSQTTVSATTGGDINCAALASETDTTPVKVGLSKENVGAVDCSATDIGVGTSSTKGKGKRYGAGSGGGAVTETACANTAACVQADANSSSAAALAAATSS